MYVRIPEQNNCVLIFLAIKFHELYLNIRPPTELYIKLILSIIQNLITK